MSSAEAELGPVLAAELQRARRLASPARINESALDSATLAEARTKEGVYACLTVLEFQMQDFVDFNEWLHGSILPEMQAVRHQCCRPNLVALSCGCH